MPLPLLIVGAAVATAGWGVKKGVDAKSDFDDAKRINEDAEEMFDDARRSLERRKERTQNSLEALGEQKIQLSKNALRPFVKAFRKIKNVDYEEMEGFDENLPIQDEILSIEEVTVRMEEVVAGAAGALGSGALAGLAAYGSVGLLGSASTGTAIAGLSGAAATNATLAWLGGGSLAAGGFGMAGGTAVLGGIVAAPVLLVGGLVMASKAEAAKEDALSNLSKAKVAAEAMETAEVAAKAIGRKANEVQKVLKRLHDHLVNDNLGALQYLVTINTDWRTYKRQEKELVGRSASLAKTAKNVAEAHLLEEDGSITKAIREVLRDAKAVLKSLDEVR